MPLAELRKCSVHNHAGSHHPIRKSTSRRLHSFVVLVADRNQHFQSQVVDDYLIGGGLGRGWRGCGFLGRRFLASLENQQVGNRRMTLRVLESMKLLRVQPLAVCLFASSFTFNTHVLWSAS